MRKRDIPGDWWAKDPKADSLAGISLEKAYLFLGNRKSEAIIVAVIDNGVDLDHEDLEGKIWTNTREIPGNGLDDDGNGFIDDLHGWNFRGTRDGTVVENEQVASTQFYQRWKDRFEDPDSDKESGGPSVNFYTYQKAKAEFLAHVTDPDSTAARYAYNLNYHSAKLFGAGSPLFRLSRNLTHGTHVAGIIAADRENHIGIQGIVKNVLIMPIVASTAVGDERDTDVANAIRYAADNGARVINMSFSKLFSSEKAMVDKAIRYAESKNVLIVHCAGNDGVNIDSIQNAHYPTAIDDSGRRATNFITVGWNRPLFDFRLAHPYSCYGKVNVDLFAPGSDIYSTVPGNKYESKSGSSMAAPVVAGVAALLFSYFPSLTSLEVKDILLKSVYRPAILVHRPGSKQDVPFGSLSASGGIVNAYAAVVMADRLVGNKSTIAQQYK